MPSGKILLEGYRSVQVEIEGEIGNPEPASAQNSQDSVFLDPRAFLQRIMIGV